jgi:hypothetical protein
VTNFLPPGDKRRFMVTKTESHEYVFKVSNTTEDQSRGRRRIAVVTTLRRTSPGGSEYRPTHREPAALIG